LPECPELADGGRCRSLGRRPAGVFIPRKEPIMAGVLELASGVLPLLYLALLIDYGATFFLRTRTHMRRPWLVGVIAVHAALLVARGIHEGHPPVTATSEILSLLAIAMAAVYAYVEFVHKDRRTGVFVLLLAFLFQYTSTILLAGRAAPAETVPAAWSRLHVLPALVAYTALAFAGIYGLLYLLAQRSLRLHRFGVFFDRLPPLDLLGTMTWHALVTGFVFMTITIASAPVMFGTGGEGAMTAKVISKIIAGSVGWLVCAAAVLGRWLGKWPPSRIAGIAVAGFLVVMALLVASGLLS